MTVTTVIFLIVVGGHAAARWECFPPSKYSLKPWKSLTVCFDLGFFSTVKWLIGMRQLFLYFVHSTEFICSFKTKELLLNPNNLQEREKQIHTIIFLYIVLIILYNNHANIVPLPTTTIIIIWSSTFYKSYMYGECRESEDDNLWLIYQSYFEHASYFERSEIERSGYNVICKCWSCFGVRAAGKH